MSKAESSSTFYEREKEPKIFSNVFPSCAGRVHCVLDISRIFGILYQLYQLNGIVNLADAQFTGFKNYVNLLYDSILRVSVLNRYS